MHPRRASAAKLAPRPDHNARRRFYCTDSVTSATSRLSEQCDKRALAGSRRLEIVPLSPIIAGWVAAHPIGRGAVANGKAAYYSTVKPVLEGRIAAAVSRTCRLTCGRRMRSAPWQLRGGYGAWCSLGRMCR